MAKFLTFNYSGQSFLLPADGFIMAKKFDATSTTLYYISANDDETIRLTHASQSGHEIADFIQDQFINLAQTNWRNAAVNITSSSPLTLEEALIT
jgi:hypothetical protein